MTTITTSNNDYDYGYIYCISNASMPDILNIGITWMTPEQRMEDINGLPRLWRPPTPYKCEFAKRVLDAEHKRNSIYKVLSQSRITLAQRFFSVSIEEVRTLFDLMDGEYWTASASAAEDIYDIPDSVDTQVYNILEKKEKEIKGIEEKMLECLFQKCDEIEMEMENKRAELTEINAIIEERKAALRCLKIDIPPPSSRLEAEQIITEY
uniref:Bacteriophage T5 Orf172 DNA-binding domain-containing protein n=1 Tax=viral metagenome TaxID=1070528 RepID=A0A6C0CCQ0_9ZZZZ